MEKQQNISEGSLSYGELIIPNHFLCFFIFKDGSGLKFNFFFLSSKGMRKSFYLLSFALRTIRLGSSSSSLKAYALLEKEKSKCTLLPCIDRWGCIITVKF